jgi:Putative amidoligase enzyme
MSSTMAIRYSADPKRKWKTVTTVNGKTEYRRNCRLIKGAYYIIDEDCFFIENRWYRVNSGYIVQDYDTKQWHHVAKCRLTSGVVEIDAMGNPIFGYFSKNPYKSGIVIIHGSKHIVRDCTMLDAHGYREAVANGYWYHAREFGSEHNRIRNDSTAGRGAYNIEENVIDFRDKQKSYNDYKIKLSPDAIKFAKYLNGITFGLEYEVSRGNMPDRVLHKNGLVICRDGSISGPEYVSVPMKGAKGLMTIQDTCAELKKRTEIDINCSLHIHIGNIPTDRASIVAYYLTFKRIQDELFKMFPYYKTDSTGVKRRNYCQKFPLYFIPKHTGTPKEIYDKTVNFHYMQIYQMLLEDEKKGIVHPSVLHNRKTRTHPVHQKFHRPGRYYALNLMNCFFSSRNTAEFRLHGPSTNSQKIINWLFICNAIVQFAQKYAHEIITGRKQFNLMNVLDYYRSHFKGDKTAEFLSEYLMNYYADRVERINKDIMKMDTLSMWDIDDDKRYVFSYKGVSDLF